ncbi:Glycosyltransferase involved in cell wall bisynthesis [Tessaracoccus oleiagri]|uniref:Glycosyltransferase involved in cell wall bisynthesis n=2 Tax=Tessaracoccus oleiagri TaxID=686624 RepID=A0A1G9N619_9ACTN|nr:Glycosyltransferase involved in cell wall bisynthesis [Tessaracoccus oleiagri]
MNTMPLVSIIVPVYNTEKYVADCLASLLDQTWTDLEVLCVDDGSTDSSLKIIHAIAARDPRLVVITQPNGGVSSARNSGLRRAKGTYVGFVDSDDTVDYTLIASLMSQMGPNWDIVIEGARRPESVVGIKEKADFASRVLRNELLNSPCGRLYRRSLIEESGLIFAEETSLGEDLLFNASYLSRARGVRTISGKRYFIREREGSLTRSFRPSKFEELMYVHDALRRILEWAASARMDSVLNYLRIKALASSLASARASRVIRDHRDMFARAKAMRESYPHLPVDLGDPQMRAVGWVYARLGLVPLTWLVVLSRWLRELTRHILRSKFVSAELGRRSTNSMTRVEEL